MDFFSSVNTNGVKIDLGEDTPNYPRAIRVLLSEEGTDWNEVGSLELVLELNQRPSARRNGFSAWFWPEQQGRWAKVCLDDYEPRYWWSVSELGIWGDYVSGPPLTSFSRPALTFELSWQSLSVQPNGVQSVVTAVNRGQETWLSTGPSGRGAVRLAFRWFDQHEQELMEPQRVNLPVPIGPGETATFSALISRPTQSGKYVLRAQLVTEGHMWQERWLTREVVIDQ
jgi:hypothetical protein